MVVVANCPAGGADGVRNGARGEPTRAPGCSAPGRSGSPPQCPTASRPPVGAEGNVLLRGLLGDRATPPLERYARIVAVGVLAAIAIDNVYFAIVQWPLHDMDV